MSTSDEQPKAKVWDPLVRIGHWTIVIGFFTAYLTGDELLGVHVWAGYAVAIAVALRLLWGFVGTKHARFSNFVTGPRAVFRYLAGIRTGSAKRYLGHNPAGAAMILALLFSLTVTTVSGMALLAVEDGRGPLAGIISAQTVNDQSSASRVQLEHGDDDDGEEYDDDHERGEGSEELLEGVHSAFTYLTLMLVALHIFGVITSSLAHKENLVTAMVTGRKRPDD